MSQVFSIVAKQLILEDISIVVSSSVIFGKNCSSDVFQPFSWELQSQLAHLEFIHFMVGYLKRSNKEISSQSLALRDQTAGRLLR